MIKFNDFSRDFLDFWEKAQDKDQEEQIRLWKELYESKHPDVFQVYFGPPYFGRREDLAAALPRYAKDVERIRKTAEGMEKLLPQIVASTLAFFDIGEEEIEIDVIAFVGVYGADGFAIPVAGRVTAFLALEQLAEYEPERVKALIAHELSHGFHMELARKAYPTLFAKILKDPLQLLRLAPGLFMEGLAVAASRRIVPGRDEPAYLFYTAAQWAWSQANRELLVEITLRALAGNDQNAYAKLFETREGSEELPYHRTGYYVGYLAIERLLERYTLRELAEMEPEEFPELIRSALANDFGRD